jgi:hypothetical protein
MKKNKRGSIVLNFIGILMIGLPILIATGYFLLSIYKEVGVIDFFKGCGCGLIGLSYVWLAAYFVSK